MNSALDRRTFLQLGAAGAALGAWAGVTSAQDKPKRGGTLTIGRNHDADTLYPGAPRGSPPSPPTCSCTTGSCSTTSR